MYYAAVLVHDIFCFFCIYSSKLSIVVGLMPDDSVISLVYSYSCLGSSAHDLLCADVPLRNFSLTHVSSS